MCGDYQPTEKKQSSYKLLLTQMFAISATPGLSVSSLDSVDQLYVVEILFFPCRC